MSRSPTDVSSASRTASAYSSGWQQIVDRINSGGSWSGRERNCCFLNTGSTRFADISAASGLDYLDDARAVLPVDWDWDGDLDLWFVNRTGPRLRFVRNGLESGNRSVAVRLRGTHCNRDALGARVELTAAGKTHKMTVRAEDGYLSQASRWMHFGLANQDRVESLRVHWPGGEWEEFSGLEVGGYFDLVQGSGRAERWTVPAAERKLEPSTPQESAPVTARRIVLQDRVPLSTLKYSTLSGEPAVIGIASRQATLINVWATWCVPCLAELKSFVEHADSLRQRGVTIVALSVDGLQEDVPAPGTAREFLDRLQFPHPSGMATPQLLDKLEVLMSELVSPPRSSGQIPASYLLDRAGRLAVIYLGPVTTEQLLADLTLLDQDAAASQAVPFTGAWYQRPYGRSGVLAHLATRFAEKGDHNESLWYAALAADLMTRDRVADEKKRGVAELFFKSGMESFQLKKLDDARQYFQQATALLPQWAEAHANLASAYSTLGDVDRALEHFGRALSLNPKLPQALYNVGAIHLKRGSFSEAEQSFLDLLEIAPNSPMALNALGLTYARQGDQASAAAFFRRALQSDPGFQDARRNLKSVLAGQRP